MKLSTAILRAFAAFVAACIIQTLAGALLLSQAKIPASPHAMEWTLFSTSLVIAALSVVAFRADLRGWRLGAALAAIPLIIGSVNAIEGIFFLTNYPFPWGRLFAFMLVSAGLIIPVWVVLFGKRSEIAPDHYHPIASQSSGEKVWKFVISDIAYSFLYLAAGTIVFPYVKDFYATQHLPSMPQILAMQLLLRGPVFILLCLALVRLLGLPRITGALAVGVVFTILSGVAPLLVPSPVFPDAVRWAHFCEVTSSNFVFGAIVGWLWGRSELAPMRALHHAV